MKMYLDNVAIEVTRRCNMNCEHCMRGDAELKDMSDHILTSFLSQISAINTLTFTGGEPTLNLSTIRTALDYCREHEIMVYNFYIVTNGKVITTEFLNLMIDWYIYCVECGGEPEYNGVALSLDQWHEKISPVNIIKLQSLSFFKPEDKDYRNRPKFPLINLGRARDLDNTRDGLTCYPDGINVEVGNDFIQANDCTITLTSVGDVLSDCDYEYDDIDDIYICSYDQLLATFEKHIEKSA